MLMPISRFVWVVYRVTRDEWYWTGSLDDLGRPIGSEEILLARLFVMPGAAYDAAAPINGLSSWRVGKRTLPVVESCYGPPRYAVDPFRRSPAHPQGAHRPREARLVRNF